MNLPDMSQLSIIELKALAYDCLATVEQNQNNLRIINSEIQRRFKNNDIENKVS